MGVGRGAVRTHPKKYVCEGLEKEGPLSHSKPGEHDSLSSGMQHTCAEEKLGRREAKGEVAGAWPCILLRDHT